MQGRLYSLPDVWIRPAFGGKGRKMAGTLEAHANGFRYTSPKGEELDIMYRYCEDLVMCSCVFHNVQSPNPVVTVELTKRPPIMQEHQARLLPAGGERDDYPGPLSLDAPNHGSCSPLTYLFLAQQLHLSADNPFLHSGL